jgi:hypothetical protein
MSVCRAAGPVLGLALALLQAGCTRASVASLLPTLEVGILAQQRRAAMAGVEQEQGQRRWAAVAFVALSFRPVRVASELPLRAELAPETWIAPCDEDDVECLQEASAAERELAEALGELQ